MNDHQLVPLRRFNAVHEADLAASALHAAGVFCDVQDRFVAGADFELGNATGGVLLRVRGSDREIAEDVLAGRVTEAREPIADDEAYDEDGPACASCGRPLRDAMDDCKFCNALPDRPVRSPKRMYHSLIAIKFGVVALVLFCGIVLPQLWDRIAALDEHTVEMAAYAVVAVIIAFVLLKALRQFDQRA